IASDAGRARRGARGGDGCGATEPPRPSQRHEQRWRLFGRSEARVVLLDEQVGLKPEVVRVGAEKSTYVGRAGDQIEALVLERLEIPHANVRVSVDLS